MKVREVRNAERIQNTTAGLRWRGAQNREHIGLEAESHTQLTAIREIVTSILQLQETKFFWQHEWNQNQTLLQSFLRKASTKDFYFNLVIP